MIEYRDWAKGQLNPDHIPSLYDWQGMPLAEMSSRALAICAEAREWPHGEYRSTIYAFQCLEAMAKAIKETYPRRSGT